MKRRDLYLPITAKVLFYFELSSTFIPFRCLTIALSLVFSKQNDRTITTYYFSKKSNSKFEITVLKGNVVCQNYNRNSEDIHFTVHQSKVRLKHFLFNKKITTKD